MTHYWLKRLVLVIIHAGSLFITILQYIKIYQIICSGFPIGERKFLMLPGRLPCRGAEPSVLLLLRARVTVCVHTT